jgi:hypothetical protein
MENTTSKVTSKYLEFLTYLYNKKYFSIHKEARDFQIDSYTSKALSHYNLISGNGQNYKWVGCEPNIKEADKIRNYCKQLRDNTRSGKDKKLKQDNKIQKVFLWDKLMGGVETDNVEEAIKLLKSKGYKIFKPVTEFKEL